MRNRHSLPARQAPRPETGRSSKVGVAPFSSPPRCSCPRRTVPCRRLHRPPCMARPHRRRRCRSSPRHTRHRSHRRRSRCCTWNHRRSRRSNRPRCTRSCKYHRRRSLARSSPRCSRCCTSHRRTRSCCIQHRIRSRRSGRSGTHKCRCTSRPAQRTTPLRSNPLHSSQLRSHRRRPYQLRSSQRHSSHHYLTRRVRPSRPECPWCSSHCCRRSHSRRPSFPRRSIEGRRCPHPSSLRSRRQRSCHANCRHTPPCRSLRPAPHRSA